MTIIEENLEISNIKRKLKNGEATVGSWMQIPDSSIAEIMGSCGYDWVAVDLEHGKFSTEKLPEIFRALELGGTQPFARVAQACSNDIKQALDSGAKGLIFPMIESENQLEQAISNALYPPLGKRGVGYARANLFGKRFESYLKKANDLVLIAQIENIAAVQELDKILQVKYLDGIMVGPYDLSASMGLTAQFEHPEFLNAMESIRRKSVKYNIPMGAHVVQPDRKLLQNQLKEGYQFIAYSIDSVFLYKSAECPKLNNR
jgi:2-dehydro-3-deoxyglucarate aldolase